MVGITLLIVGCLDSNEQLDKDLDSMSDMQIDAVLSGNTGDDTALAGQAYKSALDTRVKKVPLSCEDIDSKIINKYKIIYPFSGKERTISSIIVDECEQGTKFLIDYFCDENEVKSEKILSVNGICN